MNPLNKEEFRRAWLEFYICHFATDKAATEFDICCEAANDAKTRLGQDYYMLHACMLGLRLSELLRRESTVIDSCFVAKRKNRRNQV